MFITGSRALNFWYPQISIKPDADWDIVTKEDVKHTNKIDVAPEGLMSYEICSVYATNEYMETPEGTANIVSPKCLMLFKRSHLHRPLDFPKHIRHYHFLKSQIKDLDETYFSLLKERTRLTKEKYGDRVPSLKKTKKEFFDDYVSKVYEHDDLHYATCFGERPIYEELKTDDESVWCSRKLWENLKHEKKINCVREEAFVIAIERYLIPKKGYPAKFAFKNAVERICTTLTSGFFRDFAIENWYEIVDCDYNFVEKCENAGFRIC